MTNTELLKLAEKIGRAKGKLEEARVSHNIHLKLVEKIGRAKVKLEEARVSHSTNCSVETNPESLKPCNCGTSEVNNAIDAALRELSFD